MTPVGSQFHRRLTDDEMDLIRMVTKARGSRHGFETLWSILLGMPWDLAVATGVKYAVRDYAIPADQDRDIQRMLSVSPSRKSRKRWDSRATGMHFLFYGPATYDE